MFTKQTTWREEGRREEGRREEEGREGGRREEGGGKEEKGKGGKVGWGPVGGALIVFFYQVHDICVMLVVENCGAETWDIFGILTFSLQPFRLFEHLHVTSSYVSGTWDLFSRR